MKKLIALILISVLALSCFAACDDSEIKEAESKENVVYTTTTIDSETKYFAVIEITDYGTVTVELDQSQAPVTVQNFVNLAESGFYDGLTFHRIIEGFMMQGGDPNGNGTGGADKDIIGEFTANGHNNTISHKRGVISMARSNAYDSASSQFFIVHQDSTFLDGQYAAFGYVVDGMEVVDKVCTTATPTDSNGSIAKKNQPVIKTVTIKTGLVFENTEESSTLIEGEDISTTLDSEKTYTAVIEIENYGKITIELNQSEAPITVENFVSLAQSGFYDGLTFHRIMKDFMMQGGDPKGNGTGGSDNNIIGEFTANGYNNTISHKRGVISMARASDFNSGSSQFFIVHQDSTFLDGQYAAFGYVTEGMDVVDAICEDAEPTDSNGSIAKEAQPVITSITIEIE